MSGVNKVILIGHLGKDPEVRTIEGEKKVARFSLATTEYYRDRSGDRKGITEWHNITCWNNLAEIAEKYLTKGKQVYIEGKIRSRSWEDNGVKKYATDIVADNFTMLGSKSDSDSDKYVSNETTDTTTEEPPFLKEDSDDLPF